MKHTRVIYRPEALGPLQQLIRNPAENCRCTHGNTWSEEKAEDLQRSADRKDMKSFYTGLKEVWGPQTRSTVHLKSLDGSTTLSDNKRVLERWSQHFETLLNQPGDIEPAGS